jgi:predicted PurR-regulated permease PerM
MNKKFYLIGLGLITLTLGYLTYLLLLPFLAPITWAVVLSLVFYPMYLLIKRYVRNESLASSITLLVIIAMIVGPFSYITFMLIDEIRSIAIRLQDGNLFKELIEHPRAYQIFNKVLSIQQISAEEFERRVIDSLSGLGMTIIAGLTKNIGNVLSLIVDFVIMIFATFFLLRDGAIFVKEIEGFMPFSEEQKRRLGAQIRDVVVSTVYGGIIVALLQGLITGITLSLLGFKSPVLWGTATAVVSFVPLVGASGVWGPAAIYLFIEGAIAKGIILVIAGIFVISMIDNILKPIIIGSRTKLPVVVIFFSVLGGLSVFGLIGLIAGPLVIALFFSVIQIVRDIALAKEPPK